MPPPARKHVVTKQQPTPRTTKGGVDVLSRIAPIGFDDDEGIKTLLYGRSGTGKTTLWGTFPDPILSIICSGGSKPGELRSINTSANRGRIDQVVLEDTSEIAALVEFLNQEDSKYNTVVLDHATGLQDKKLAEILGVVALPAQKGWGVASQQQYGQCTLECKEMLRALLGLSCNVVIIAQERESNNEGGSDLITPTVGAGLTPSLAGWLNTAVDYICQTFIRQHEEIKTTTIGKGPAAKNIETVVRTNKVDFCLRVAPHPVYTTKFRMPKGTNNQDFLIDPTYEKIKELIDSGNS